MRFTGDRNVGSNPTLSANTSAEISHFCGLYCATFGTVPTTSLKVPIGGQNGMWMVRTSSRGAALQNVLEEVRLKDAWLE